MNRRIVTMLAVGFFSAIPLVSAVPVGADARMDDAGGIPAVHASATVGNRPGAILSFHATMGGVENKVDQAEPTNDACAGAEPWDLLFVDKSGGSAGGQDLADWSSVPLLRTENVTATVSSAVVQIADPACTAWMSGTPSTSWSALRDGLHFLRVTPTEAGTPHAYVLGYVISPNDANSGIDVGDSIGDAYAAVATPDGMEVVYYGGLAKRDRVLDEDWYRIHVPLPIPGGDEVDVPAALVTVNLRAECATSGATFILADAEGRPLFQPATSCGNSVRRSCVALGPSYVHVQLGVSPPASRRDAGTSYHLWASAHPIRILKTDLDPANAMNYINEAIRRSATGDIEGVIQGSSAVVTTTFDPTNPWCNSLMSPSDGKSAD